MIAYTIKVYLTNGEWGYCRPNDFGGFNLTDDVSSTVYFDTVAEAKDYYYRYIKGHKDQYGVAVDGSRCAIIQVSGACF